MTTSTKSYEIRVSTGREVGRPGRYSLYLTDGDETIGSLTDEVDVRLATVLKWEGDGWGERFASLDEAFDAVEGFGAVFDFDRATVEQAANETVGGEVSWWWATGGQDFFGDYSVAHSDGSR